MLMLLLMAGLLLTALVVLIIISVEEYKSRKDFVATVIVFLIRLASLSAAVFLAYMLVRALNHEFAPEYIP